MDEKSGTIISVRKSGVDREWVNGELNNYVYLPGSDVQGAKGSGPVKLSICEPGPLVASIVVESDAPGCNKLVREVRLVDGLDRIEIVDIIDKKPVRNVEGVHFGFSFNVPQPEVRINSPGAVARPEKDQIAGACKNWFSVERWVDISNDKYGVTWTTADAPLLELGGLTANLPRTQPNANAYLKHIEPSATLYSWVMNNHWHTNYRADQEGPTPFRFAIRLHDTYDSVAAMRFGVESTTPLVVAPAMGSAPAPSPLRLDNRGVLTTAYKPSDDGKAVIIRLLAASGMAETVTPSWTVQPKAVWLSDASELPLAPLTGSVQIPGWGLVTIRAEMP